MSLTKDDEAKLVKALTEAADLAHAFIENKVLDDAWTGAVNNFVDKQIDPRANKRFIAKCWVQSVLWAIDKAGYEVKKK